MNPKKFFEECKALGINEAQVSFSRSTTFSAKLFHGQLDSYTVADSQGISAKGIKNGKMGSAATQKLDSKTPALLAAPI